MQFKKPKKLDEVSSEGADKQGLCIPLVYQELRRLATQYLQAESIGQTLSGTALVHEAFLRLDKSDASQNWNDARHVFYATALVMRRILVDRARQKKSLRRGGTFRRVELESTIGGDNKIKCDSLEQLSEAMLLFEKEFPAAAELVNLWYFGGLTMIQAAGVMRISRSTAHRHWKFAKAWLSREMALQQDCG